MSQNTVRKKPRLNHKFRFQLLHEWLVETFEPCNAADIGGGKGLLSYLLINNGWNSTVIDPIHQLLPWKFRDIKNNQRIKLTYEERKIVPRVNAPFEEEMAKDYDLLIGLHAHGCNMKIINACNTYKKDFVLLPCCVIDEPIIKEPGINWLDSLVAYGIDMGFNVKKATLNFAGQRTVIYSDKYLKKKNV